MSDVLSELVSSRICHDLISPLGAIGNGLELLDMTAMADVPELDLIRDSITNAQARIRFCRIAYSAAAEGQSVGRRELAEVLDDLYKGTRLTVIWHPAADVPRTRARLAMLAIQCVETALGQGGTIDIREDGGVWTVAAMGPKLNAASDPWAYLAGRQDAVPLRASEVQFLLMRRLIEAEGLRLEISLSETVLCLQF